VPAGGAAYLHRQCVPLDQADLYATWAENKRKQLTIFDDMGGAELSLLEHGDPDGCSPYGCRSGASV
jgi:hypothetical protein